MEGKSMERTVGTSLLLQMMRNRVFEVNEEYYLYLNKVEDKLLKYETVSIGEWEGIFKGSNLSQDEYGNFKKIWVEAYVRYYFFRKALKDLPNTTDITDAVSQPEMFKSREFSDWKFLISLSHLKACTFFNRDRLWAVKKFMKLKGDYRPMSYIQCSTSELIDTTPIGVNVNAVNIQINNSMKRIELRNEFKSIKEMAITLPAGTKFYYDENLELFIDGKHIKTPPKDTPKGKVVIQTDERSGYVVSENTPELIAQCISNMTGYFPNRFCGRLVDGDYFMIVKVLKGGQTYGRPKVDRDSIRYSEVEDYIYFESSVSKEVRK